LIQRNQYSFLKDVAVLSVTCFGGPQAHIAHFQNLLVAKRKYLTEDELIETNALCQVLPGPTSTQTLSAIGYRLGGPLLAYITLLIWITPSVLIMTSAAILLGHVETKEISHFTRFIQPMAVGFVSFAAWTIIKKIVTTKRAFGLMMMAAIASYFIRSPIVFPATLLVAGAITSLNYKAHPREEKKKFEVPLANLYLWGGVLIFAALLGAITRTLPGALPIRLFENFYRNGSLIFGGGQVLTPLLYTEFVRYGPKQYLNTDLFLSGYALVQALPGPVFSFSAYIGALAMAEKGYGYGGEITGALMSVAGIFLPGTFLIFFMVRIWANLKQYRMIRASMEGINAANAGLVAAAAVFLFLPLITQAGGLQNTILNFSFTISTFVLLTYTKMPPWLIIVTGLILAFLLP
jgi:chromate transporter